MDETTLLSLRQALKADPSNTVLLETLIKGLEMTDRHQEAKELLEQYSKPSEGKDD